MQKPTIVLADFPRFFVPEWGPTPIPAAAKPALDPALVPTNGYDFTNNVNGDAYVFLPSTEGFGAARRAFVVCSPASLTHHLAELLG